MGLLYSAEYGKLTIPQGCWPGYLATLVGLWLSGCPSLLFHLVLFSLWVWIAEKGRKQYLSLVPLSVYVIWVFSKFSIPRSLQTPHKHFCLPTEFPSQSLKCLSISEEFSTPSPYTSPLPSPPTHFSVPFCKTLSMPHRQFLPSPQRRKESSQKIVSLPKTNYAPLAKTRVQAQEHG